MAAILAWLAANPIAAAVITVVLGIFGYKNKDKVQGFFSDAKDKAEGAGSDVKAKASIIGDKVKAKFEDVLGDITGIGDSIESGALLIATLALRRHYLDNVAAEDAEAVNAAFQSLTNINAKLPVTKTTT